jgi:polygalacturonase
MIQGSPSLEDWADMGVASESRSTSLIWAKDAENISITGDGIIDGNEKAFITHEDLISEWHVYYDRVRQGKDFKSRLPDGPLKPSGRPGMMMVFINCENLLFEDFAVQNSPTWNVHLAGCRYVNFRGITVLNSLLVPNADALDISQSQHVCISGCTLIAGDDGIAISPCAEGFSDEETSNITVTNTTIESRSAAIRIGWHKNRISNCVFQNLILNSNRGILINARHTETIENLIFSDIVINTRLHTGWWGKAEPIHVSQMQMADEYTKAWYSLKEWPGCIHR